MKLSKLCIVISLLLNTAVWAENHLNSSTLTQSQLDIENAQNELKEAEDLIKVLEAEEQAYEESLSPTEKLEQHIQVLLEQEQYEQAYLQQLQLIELEDSKDNYQTLSSIFYKLDASLEGNLNDTLKSKHLDVMIKADNTYPKDDELTHEICWYGLTTNKMQLAQEYCELAYELNDSSMPITINLAHVKYYQDDKQAFDTLLNFALSQLSSEEEYESLKHDFYILENIYSKEQTAQIINYIETSWDEVWHEYSNLTNQRYNFNGNEEYDEALKVVNQQKQIIKNYLGENNLTYATLLLIESYYKDKLEKNDEGLQSKIKAEELFTNLDYSNNESVRNNTEYILNNYIKDLCTRQKPSKS